MIQHLETPKNYFNFAIPFIILADLFSAIQAVFVKLGSFYLSVNTLIFIVFLVNLLMLYGWVICTEGKGGFRKLYKVKIWRYHFLRSVFGVAAIYALYYGVLLMPIGPATLLYFTFPLFIPFVSRIWLNVAMIHRLWWGLGLSFLGILFVLHVRKGVFNSIALIPLLGSLFCSISTVSLRALNYYRENSKTIIAYYFTFGVLISGLIFAFFRDLSNEQFTLFSTGIAIFVGIFAALFQVFLTLSIKYAPIRFLSPFIYGVFIFSSLGDYWVFGVKLDQKTAIGFLLICLGAVLMLFLYPKEERKLPIR